MQVKKYSDKLVIAASQKVKEKKYWMGIFSENIHRTYLPYDAHENGEQGKFKTLEIEFQKQIYEKTQKICKASDYTLNILLQAGVLVLINKYTGNLDITIGTPIYQQGEKGEFINTSLALRFKIKTDITFKELLKQAKTTLMEAIQYQDYPIELLVKDLGLTSSENRFPLFEIAVQLDNIHDPDYIAHIPLNLSMRFSRKSDDLRCTLEYNSLLYHRETIDRLMTHFQVALEKASENLDKPLKELEIISPEEKQQLLFDFNRIASVGAEDYQKPTLHEWFEDQVERTSDHVAMIFQGDCLTYCELNLRANQKAWYLRELGVNNNTLVGMMIHRSFDMIIAIIAIFKAGGAYLPIDTEYPENRVLSMLKDSNVSYFITEDTITRTLPFISLLELKNGIVNPVLTAPRSQIKDFNSIPRPDRRLTNYKRIHNYLGCAMAKHTVTIQASRGCPFNCAYCHKIWPKSHVVRSAEHIFDEIMYCYESGARRFTFIDDVFNLNRKNSEDLLSKIIDQDLDIQIFFPNGLRGDILTKDIIDLMIKAGTVNLALAVESVTPRIQELIGKKLNLEKFKKNIDYIIREYPHILLEMELMIGFPTETEEEAFNTLSYLKNLKWVDFPNLHILKIYQNTEMYRIAIENGISHQDIEDSTRLAFHEVPETTPFSKSFVRKFQILFMNEYFLSKQRLLDVLPHQMKIMNEDELVQKYNMYLPMEIRKFTDILNYSEISMEELGDATLIQEDPRACPGFFQKERTALSLQEKEMTRHSPLKILLLDLSQLFTHESTELLNDSVEAPLGLMYLLTYLNKKFGRQVYGKIIKSRIDFESYDELKILVEEFKPDLIGVRTLSFYREFFHRTLSLMRQWGVRVPIVAGGPYATSEYGLVLQDFHVDLVVMGEGEITFAELIQKILENGYRLPGEEELSQIQGLAFILKEDKERLKRLNRQIIPIDQLRWKYQEYPGNNLTNVTKPHDMVYVLYTSGSTGKPKGVILNHQNVVNLIHYDHHYTQIDCSRILQFHTIGFDASFHEIFCPLLKGGRLYLIDKDTRSIIPEMLKLVQKNLITTLFLPMSLLKIIFNDAKDEYFHQISRSIRHIQTAGEQVVVGESFRKYLQTRQVYLHNHYGPSETHVVTALTIKPGEQIPEYPTIGEPILNTSIYILDEHQQLMPIGAVGELFIGGLQVGVGYLGAAEQTEERFLPDPFNPGGARMYRSGDLARRLPDGNIEFLGRADHQVKIRGFRVELGEIESQLIKHRKIEDVVVVALKEDSGNKYICAYYVPRITKGETDLEVSDLRDFIGKNLPDYMAPTYFVQLESIPLGTSGKVDRKALPDPIKQGDNQYIAPGNNTEKQLAHIWREILGVSKVGIFDNFFELGGHSLKAIVLLSKIHKIFQKKVSLGEMFKEPTINGLSGYIGESEEEKYHTIEPVEKREYYLLSSAQRRLYFFQELEPDNTSYNLSQVIPLAHQVDKKRMEDTFIKLIHRHQSLRTSFRVVGEDPVQQVHDRVNFNMSYYEVKGPNTQEIPDNQAEKIISDFVKPFDMSQAPLIRVAMIRVKGRGQVLLFDWHHIVTDGISQDIFAREFFTLYQGDEATLAPIKLQYVDYSQWIGRQKQMGTLNKQETYWVERFQGDIPVLNLPTDYPRPEYRKYEGRTTGFQISEKETKALKELASQMGTTLNVVCMTLFNILLSKICIQEEIIVGTPTAGRNHDDLAGIMGMFVNMLVLRNHLPVEKSFSQSVQTVQTSLMEAMENQDFQFEDLVERLYQDRDMSRNPLFDVVFFIQNFETRAGQDSSEKIIGHQPRACDEAQTKANFDMLWVGREHKDALHFTLDYIEELFKKETLQRFISYFKKIIAAVIKENHLSLGEIEILTETEKNQLVYEYNHTEVQYPRERTYHQLFEVQVENHPEGIAVIERETHSFITYRALNSRANQLALFLNSGGITNESLILLQLTPSINLVQAVMATLKAGAAFLPVGTECPKQRLEYILKDSNPCLWITENRFMESHSLNLDNIDYPAHRILKLDSDTPYLRESHQNLETDKHPLDIMYVIYTSGTTGKPKGVMIQEQSLVNYVTWAIRTYIRDERLDFPLYTSISFDLSLTSLFTPLISGNRIWIYQEQEDVMLIEKIIDDHHTGIIKLTPTHLTLLRDKEIDKGESADPRKMIVGGEEFPYELAREILHNFKGKIELYNEYGPTEATIGCMIYTYDPDQDTGNSVPIGTPSDNTQVYLLDPLQKPVPIGVTGEMYLSGDGIARGYLNNPRLTEERFIPNPFVPGTKMYQTGDLALRKEDGNIQYLGRKDQQVKIRGYRIELGEVEACLKTYPGIKEARVLVNQTDGDKNLCAYIVTLQEITITDIIEYVKGFLPQYMIPAYVVPIDHLPFTEQGKLDVNALPKPGVGEVGETYVAPSDSLEQKLVEIWSLILKVDRGKIGVHTNFFKLGGHSLRATVVISRIHKDLDVKIPLITIFKEPYIKGLARHIREAKKEEYVSIPSKEKREYYPLASAQKRLYILQQMEKSSTSYNMPHSFPLTREMDVKRVEQVFKQLVQEHEILRTSFIVVQEEPVQRVHDTAEITVQYVKAERKEVSQIIKDFEKPFDLAKAPLIRLGFITIEATHHVLLFDLHHIVTDGTSQELLTNEFIFLYNQGEKTSEKNLSTHRLQYKDYAAWQNSREQTEVMKHQESYWKELYADEIPILNLPADFQRPLIQSFEGALVGFSLNSQDTITLKQLALDRETTLYMMLLAIYNVLLSKLSAQEDVIVGTPIAARRHADLEGVIGMFVNTLAMRNFPSNGKTFMDFLTEVREQTLRAYENQEYQFEDLVETISVKRDTSRNPVFDVMFNLLNEAEYNGDVLEQVKEEGYVHIERTSKFDLNLSAIDFGDQLFFSFEYCTRIFTSRTIERFIGYFKTIISLICKNPEVLLSDIGIITEKEIAEVLDLSRGNTGQQRKNNTIHALFEDQTEKVPDLTALIYENTYFSYLELNKKSNQLAKNLIHKGVNTNSIVALKVERSIEMIISILAVLKAGAGYLPIDPQYPEERQTYMLRDSGITHLLTDALTGCPNKGVPVGRRGEPCVHPTFPLENLEEIQVNDSASYTGKGENPGIQVQATDLAYVIYTSGTTGRPKGVLLEHRNLVNLMTFNLTASGIDFQKVLQFHTIGFDASFNEIFCALLSGGALLLINKDLRGNVVQLLKLVETHHIGTLFLPMSFLKVIFLENQGPNAIPTCVRHIQTAGEQVKVSPEFRKYLQANQVYLHNHYGPSEAHVVTTLTLDPQKEIPEFPTIGTPILNTEIYILDNFGHLQPIGVPGELCIGGIQVGRGYLGRGQLTEEKFIPNPFNGNPKERLYCTGDLARWQNNGEIELLGRIDQQVKIRGFRIEPGEIEKYLLRFPEIQDAVVITLLDKEGEKQLCAYLVSSQDLDPTSLRDTLSTQLPDYMIPTHMLQIKKIPLTPSGKLNRHALPEPQIKISGSLALPETEVERKLAGIWSDLLNIEEKKISVDHNFFQIGGHSLKATIMVYRISREFEVEISLSRIFLGPYIRQLAKLIQEAKKIQYQEICPVEKREYYPQSSGQKRLFFIHHFQNIGTSYNMPSAIRITGKMDMERFQRAVELLVKRQEVLRTSFQLTGDENEPVQVVHDAVESPIRDLDLKKLEITAPIYAEAMKRLIDNFVQPFDLSKAPLMRIAVATIAEEEHILLYDMNHIICDGTSAGIMVNDFVKLYGGEQLREIRIQYKDFSLWQQQSLKSGKMKQQLEYWVGLFEIKEKIPKLQLPTDLPRPEMISFKGDEYEFRLDKDYFFRFKKLGLKYGATLYMNFLAAFNVLLYKYTGQEDIIVGGALAGRPHTDLQRIMGFFVNVLGMRNYPKNEKRYCDFLEEVRDNSLKAFENQDVQFEELVDSLNLGRDASVNPLFSVLMVVQNFEKQEIQTHHMRDTQFNYYDYENKTCKFDMQLFANELGDEINFLLEFATQIFEKTTIQKFANRFIEVLKQVIDDEEVKLKDITLSSTLTTIKPGIKENEQYDDFEF
jgi:tyrocidine synthetase-3